MTFQPFDFQFTSAIVEPFSKEWLCRLWTSDKDRWKIVCRLVKKASIIPGYTCVLSVCRGGINYSEMTCGNSDPSSQINLYHHEIERRSKMASKYRHLHSPLVKSYGGQWLNWPLSNWPELANYDWPEEQADLTGLIIRPVFQTDKIGLCPWTGLQMKSPYLFKQECNAKKFKFKKRSHRKSIIQRLATERASSFVNQ